MVANEGGGRPARSVVSIRAKSMIVKKKQAQPDASDDTIFASPADGQCAGPREGVADTVGLHADAMLVERCVAGEVAAWEALYGQCHEPLLTSVRIMLGRQSNDANLVDEIAARVWYALVAKDGELLARYDSKRGARLVTFLRALAKDEISRHFRAEVRRRKRELEVLREKGQHPGVAPSHPVDSLAEFLCTLTAHERAFCSDYLLAQPTGAPEKLHSEANVWQLTHRIYLKLMRFLHARS